MENDYACPDDVWGEGHMDGEIVGGATWAIREVLGDNADAVLYGALGLISSNPSLQDYGEAILATTDALVSDGDLTSTDATAVQEVLDTRGISRCGRALAMVDGTTERSHWLGADSIGGLIGGGMGAIICEYGRSFGVMFPMPFQFSFTTPPPGAPWTSASLTVDLADADGGDFADGDLDYAAYVRKDEMVTFTAEDFMGMGYTLVTGADAYDTEIPDAPTTIEITDLEPATTYYVAFAGLNCPVVSYSATLSVTADVDPGDTGLPSDTGEDREDKGEKGCGCATGSGSPVGLLGILLAGLVGWRRRGSVKR